MLTDFKGGNGSKATHGRKKKSTQKTSSEPRIGAVFPRLCERVVLRGGIIPGLKPRSGVESTGSTVLSSSLRTP